MRLGHGVDPGVAYGPCSTRRSASASPRTSPTLAGGAGALWSAASRRPASDYERGFFFEPTLVDHAADDAR